MSEKEVIEQIKEILKARELHKEIIKCAGGSCFNCKPDILALEGVLQILEQKDNRIAELEKALIEEELKNSEKINDAIKCVEMLQSSGTSCNNGDLQLVLDILEE